MSEYFPGFILLDGRTVCRDRLCFDRLHRLDCAPKNIARALHPGLAAGRTCAGCGKNLNGDTVPAETVWVG